MRSANVFTELVHSVSVQVLFWWPGLAAGCSMKCTHARLCATQTWEEGGCWENTVHTPPASVGEMAGAWAHS